MFLRNITVNTDRNKKMNTDETVQRYTNKL